MSISYNSREYVRFGTKPRRGAAVRFFPFSGEQQSIGYVVMVEAHNLDWSLERSQLDREKEEIESLLCTVSEALKDLIVRGENLTESLIGSGILSAYQRAHTRARELGTVASLLTAFWFERHLSIASVGICKCYLARDKKTRQLNTDDYNRMLVNNVLYTSSIILSNIIGMGRIESNDDIHFAQFNIRPHDIMVLASESFHQNVSEDEISLEAINREPSEVCDSLAKKAIEKSDPSDPLALCVIKFQE